MFCYFSVVISFLIASTFARHIRSNTEEHNNRSLCEGKELTEACIIECKSEDIEPLCTLEHLCICTYPPGLRTDIVDENRIAVVMINLQSIDSKDGLANSDKTAVPADDIKHELMVLSQNDYQGQDETSNSTLHSNLNAVSPVKINVNLTEDNHFTLSEGFPPLNDDSKSNDVAEETGVVKVEPQPEHVISEYNHKVVWTEPGFQGSVNFDSGVGSQTSTPNLIKSEDKDDDKGQKLKETSENEQSTNLNKSVQDEEDMSVMSAKPIYKKYFTMERNIQTLITNQTFAMSVILIYFAIGMLFYYHYFYKKEYVSVPLSDYK